MAMNGIEQEAVIETLDKMIRRAAPDAVSLPKYGGTLYTLKPEQKEGQFCGVFAYKDHVQLAFSDGTLLEDPKGLLTGTGKFRRHINVSQVQDVDRETLAEVLANAVQVSLGKSQD